MKMSVSDYYDSCLTSEKQELAKYLSEDGLLNLKNTAIKNKNLLDEVFIESLNVLKNKRHLLTKEQEDFINSLATKIKYF